MKKFILSCVALLCAVGTIFAQSSLVKVASATLEQGVESQLEIVLTNGSMKVNTLGFNLYLPSGMEFVLTDGQITASTSDRTIDHTISCALQDDGSGYYLLMSMTNANLKGTDGVIFTTPVKVTGDPGEYQVMLNNIEVVDEDLEAHRTDVDTYFPITVVAQEEKRYGQNQLYVKDITINEGENATLEVGYNSTSDVYEYNANISLPEGVEATGLTFCDAVNVNKYENEWSFENGILNVTGAQGKKGALALSGDNIIATATLSTAGLAPGTYTITVYDQYLSNDDDDFSPASYDAILTVNGSSAQETACATPLISINKEGHVVATSATEGAQIHTTITSDDINTFHHASGEPVEMTGRYMITSYASAPGMADSKPATAMLVWSKGAGNTESGIDELEADTERALLIRSVGEYVEIVGTETGESILVYNLSGVELYNGPSVEGVTTIPVALTHCEIYVITVGSHAFKYKF